MMSKKILVTGLMIATMVTISACGSKNTVTETTTVPETTTVAVTTTSEETTTVPVTTVEETTEKVVPGQLSKEDIRSFAEEIQITVADKDLDALADLCEYPVYVGLDGGKGSEIQDKEGFLALTQDKVFTEELLKEVAETDIEALEEFGAGYILGGEINIIFNNVGGAPAIVGINL